MAENITAFTNGISIEDIKSDLSWSKNYQDLYDNSIVILAKMQRNFASELYWSTNAFNRRLDVNNPVTIFEKEWAKLIEKSKNIAEKSSFKKAGIDLLVKYWYERVTEEAKKIMSETLGRIQGNALKNLKEDLSDGTLNNINNINVNWIIGQWTQKWRNLFYSKENDTKWFPNYLKSLSDKDLFVAALNLKEWVWAFGQAYNEILTRLWNSNIFDYIDKISSKRWPKNDQIRDSLMISCVSTLLTRSKTWDFKKYFESYSKKNELKEIIKNNFKNSNSLKKWVLLKIDFLKTLTGFDVNSLIRIDENVKEALNEYDKLSDIKIDVFSQKKVNWLFLFDFEGHGWWRAYFDSNLKYFKDQWFSVVSNHSDAISKTVKLKKWDDTVTLVVLKTDSNDREKNINTAINNIKKTKENYNLFALRWHCYTTDSMAKNLWNIVGKWDILIDWWCRNANKLSSYKKAWVDWVMFAYTAEWKWGVTEYFVDQIFKFKNNGSLDKLLSSFNSDNQNSNATYLANNLSRPDSAYYYYSINSDK